MRDRNKWCPCILLLHVNGRNIRRVVKIASVIHQIQVCVLLLFSRWGHIYLWAGLMWNCFKCHSSSCRLVTTTRSLKGLSTCLWSGPNSTRGTPSTITHQTSLLLMSTSCSTTAQSSIMWVKNVHPCVNSVAITMPTIALIWSLSFPDNSRTPRWLKQAVVLRCSSSPSWKRFSPTESSLRLSWTPTVTSTMRATGPLRGGSPGLSGGSNATGRGRGETLSSQGDIISSCMWRECSHGHKCCICI